MPFVVSFSPECCKTWAASQNRVIPPGLHLVLIASPIHPSRGQDALQKLALQGHGVKAGL